MRVAEILVEKQVQSSWITDIVYNRPNKVLTLTLSSGRSYTISGLNRRTFERWVSSPSKGKFFHNFIKGIHRAVRLR